MLVKFTSFLSTLRWPEWLNEMGKFGASFLEVFILLEIWMGHRLLPEKTVPARNRPGRCVNIDSPPVSEGVQIRVGCQFVGSMFRRLGRLPGGLGRFVPGSLGPHLCRLHHLAWLQCSHGLSCRPLESSLPGCLGPLLDLLGYPAGGQLRLFLIEFYVLDIVPNRGLKSFPLGGLVRGPPVSGNLISGCTKVF